MQEHDQPIGGYALSDGPSYEGGTIVLCLPFFALGQEYLTDIKKTLDKDRCQQKSPTALIGKDKVLLHEMGHLADLSGSEDDKSVLRTVGGCRAVADLGHSNYHQKPDLCARSYPPAKSLWNVLVQRMGDSFRQRACSHLNGEWLTKPLSPRKSQSQQKRCRLDHTSGLTTLLPRKADSYAWYASLKYFELFYGTADFKRGAVSARSLARTSRDGWRRGRSWLVSGS